MKENLLESRLENYAKSTAEYCRSCKSNAAFLFTASAAAGLGGLICPPPAEAAIQYSGLQGLPLGKSILPAVQYLDLDGDAVNDFSFAFLNFEYNYTGGSVRYNLEQKAFLLDFPSGNSVIAEQSVINSGTLLSPARLPGNYTIQNSLPASGNGQWKSTASSNVLAVKVRNYAGYYSTAGNTTITYSNVRTGGKFKGKKGYLGVRFQISGETHYGWIRFMADDDLKNGRIMDWAYEDQPNTPIKAGAGLFNWNLFMPAMLNGIKSSP